MSGDTYMDYTPFASPQFNPTAYANSILAGETYDPEQPAVQVEQEKVGTDEGRRNGSNAIQAGGSASLSVRGDVSVALAKLNYGIEDIDNQIKSEIELTHPLLLTHLTRSASLSSTISQISSALSHLSLSLSRLNTKIHTPHEELEGLVGRLNRLREAGEWGRRLSRGVVLLKRLERQMGVVRGQETKGQKGQKEGEEGEREERERELVRAGLTLAELDTLLTPPASTNPNTEEEPNLTEINFIKAQLPRIKRDRDEVIDLMERMIVEGLAGLNQSLLSTSLQTAHNLKLLPQLVGNLLADLNDAVELRIGRVFDMDVIGKEVGGREQSSSAATSLLYRSTRTKTSSTPNNQNSHIFQEVLWNRLDLLLEDIAQCCVKVYTLEKVLRMKKVVSESNEFDSLSGNKILGTDGQMGQEEESFLDECLGVMEEKPTFTFWTTLATSLDTQSRAICDGAGFLQQTLGAGYPRLLRLFHGFFAKIAVHTETVYSQEHQSPETVLCLRSISKFETLYLSRSTSRMTESINSAFSGGTRQPPGAKEGAAVARIMLNEMDSARFDPLLGRGMARLVVKALEATTTKVDGLLVKDFSATSLIGPLASSAQVVNSSLVSFLYHIVHNLRNPFTEFPPKINDLLEAQFKVAERIYGNVTTALDVSIKREISNVLARIHRVDFAKSVDPMRMSGGSGGSPYIKDLADRLTFLRTEVLGRFEMGEFRDEWLVSLTRHAIHAFLLNASIARPLGESGKLKLTGDMTELEFALNTFLMTGNPSRKGALKLDAVGAEYKGLRAFRTCLFLDDSSLSHPSETQGISPLVLLHHLVVLSPLQLPHQIHSWSEQEYILWVDKHTDEECWRLLEKAVDGQREGKGAEEWREAIREVLNNARTGKMVV